MALTALRRKRLLTHGDQKKIAFRFALSDAFVSFVMNGHNLPVTPDGWKNYRKVQNAIARKLGMTVEEAFSERERGEKEEVPQSNAA